MSKGSDETTERVYLSPPHMGKEELGHVQEAFRSNWLAPIGPHVDRFEEELARHAGTRGAVALSSGTAAIHLALKIVGVEPGDEVLCQSFTFVGSVNPILYLSARPVLIDSEPESWNMDPDLLEAAILDGLNRNKKPAAILVVHLYGMPARMKAIRGIAERYSIPVIEDAAEAVGSIYQGNACGGLGDLGIYSFNGNKIITTTGGGALLADKQKWLDRARYLASQAKMPASHYEHDEVGYNYRLSNVLAGIGIGQLSVLRERMAARREHFENYRDGLRGEELPSDWKPDLLTQSTGFSSPFFQAEPEDSRSNRWLTTLLIPERAGGESMREAIMSVLIENRIECRRFWKPMHLQPLYRQARFWESGVSEALFRYGLCLPSGSSLTKKQRERIITLVGSCIDRGV